MRIAVAGATGLVGTQLVRAALDGGYQVVRLSRSDGIDLEQPVGLRGLLEGTDAVVDVTRAPTGEREAASRFFATVAANLGRAAAQAGVRRTVVLSIVGVEEAQEVDWYAATLAHEQATREHAPGACVLRATQFHELPGQLLGTARDGRAVVMDAPVQPVESAEVARLLLNTLTAPRATDVEVAGPRVERLVELAGLVAAGSGTEVVPLTAPASVTDGALLPGPSALLRGRDWRTWWAALRARG